MYRLIKKNRIFVYILLLSRFSFFLIFQFRPSPSRMLWYSSMYSFSSFTSFWKQGNETGFSEIGLRKNSPIRSVSKDFWDTLPGDGLSDQEFE